MHDLIGNIHRRLIKTKRTLAVAESCTGGLLAKILTDRPLSSKYFLLGLVAYSNNIKIGILKVPARIVIKRGAVSCEVAKIMAQSVRNLAKANFGIGITGIAGPSPGTSNKPIGTVFISVTNGKKTICEKLKLSGSRSLIRKKSALQSLKLLKTIL